MPLKDRKQLIRNEVRPTASLLPLCMASPPAVNFKVCPWQVVEWLSTKQEEEAADGEDGNGEASEADIDEPP